MAEARKRQGTLSLGHLALNDCRKQHSFFLKLAGVRGRDKSEQTALSIT